MHKKLVHCIILNKQTNVYKTHQLIPGIMLPCSVNLIVKWTTTHPNERKEGKGKEKGIVLKSVDLYCKAVFTNQFYDQS